MASVSVTNDIEDVVSIKCHTFASVELCRSFMAENHENNFKVVAFNIRCYNKNFDNFIVSLKRFNTEVDAIILSECWLTEGTIIQPLPGFQSFRSNRQLNKNGGVIIYLKSVYQATVQESKIVDADSVILEVNNKFTFLGIYRSPSIVDLDPFLDSLDNVLKSLQKQRFLILAGDCNINTCDPLNKQVLAYLCITASHGLLPAITQPTRLESCLDHIFVKSKSEAYGLICKTSVTDHSIALLGVCQPSQKDSRKLQFKPKINFNHAVSELNSTDWSAVTCSPCVNTAVGVFNSIVTAVLSKHTKNVTVSRKMAPLKPWITPGLIRCMRHRDKLHLDYSNHPNDIQRRIIYVRYRNYCNKLLRKIKADYHSNLLEANKNDPKRLWKTIKNICYTSKQPNMPTELVLGKDPSNALNHCNHHFVSVGNKLASAIMEKLKKSEELLIQSHRPDTSCLHSLFFCPTNPSEIANVIASFNTDSASGPDNISVKLLKHTIKSILVPLNYIFNLSLETGYFPDCWKVAAVSPIHKSGSKSSPDNYRPIALLSVVSKVLEKLVNTRLVSYLEKHNLLSDKQFGFRRGRSTEDAVTLVVNLISSKVDKGKRCIGAFLDLAKAFDSVSVGLLLKKLDSFGVRGVALQWFENYLSNRQQHVKVGNHISDSLPIIYGVPQGSILGPTLFLMYINEILSQKIANAEIITYADDTAIIFHGDTWEEVFKVAENGLTTVSKTLDRNLLTLNTSKTKYITFSKTCVFQPPVSKVLKIHHCKNNPLQNLCCSCSCISRKTNIKYLGVTIDQNLSYKRHILDVSSRIRKLTYIMKNLRDCAPITLLRQIYLALCQPIIQYCISVWGSAGKTVFITVERSQRALIKVILRKPFRYSTDTLYKDFKVLRVRQMFILNAVLKTHYSLSQRHDFDLIMHRRGYRIPVPCVGSLIGRRSPTYSFPCTYNTVCRQADIDISNISKFEYKKTLTTWFLSLSYDETEILIGNIYKD